jgi:hypothetical protein
MKSIPYVHYNNDEVITLVDSYDNQFSILYKRIAFAARFIILLFIIILIYYSVGAICGLITHYQINRIEKQTLTLLKAVNTITATFQSNGNTIRERQEFMRGYFQRLDDVRVKPTTR